jgi:hypothetical protein
MFTGIEFDFTHEIETKHEPMELYVLVLGQYSVSEKDATYKFTINDHVTSQDISHVIEALNIELYNEIEKNVKKKVNEYIISSEEE